MALRLYLLADLPFSPIVSMAAIYVALNCGFYLARRGIRREHERRSHQDQYVCIGSMAEILP